MQTLSYFPGQEVSIFLEIKDGYNTRVDPTTAPIVTKVIFPGLTLGSAYPQLMTKIETGLYYHKFTLPVGAISIGNYLVDVSYTNPFTNLISNQAYQIIVTAPYGNFSTTVSV